MNYSNIIQKLLKKSKEYATLLMIKSHEHKKRIFENEVTYLFFRKRRSKKLVVVFSGMGSKRAVYNYIKTLKGIPHNRLYVLDNYGIDGLGCYYIGTNGNKEVYQSIKELLERLRKKYHIEHMIFCGSSKGGYAALNFGLNYTDSSIISGAPQYRLGYYLTHRKSPQLLYSIAGEQPSSEYLAHLDTIIEEKLKLMSKSFSGKLFLHYSDQEHTYPEHIRPLLDTLSTLGYHWNEEVMHYPEHDDVSKYFPIYLRSTIETL